MMDYGLASGVWGLVGALLGAAVGGYATYQIERRFRKEDRALARRERINRIHRTTHKIFNEILNIRRDFLQNLPDEFDGSMWQYITPMIGVDPAPLNYNIDDISVISGPKFDELSNDLGECADFRNTIVASIFHYNEIRGRLAESLMPYTLWEKGKAATHVAYRENAAIVLLENEVESLARQLAASITEMHDKVYNIGPEYNQMLDDLLGPENRSQIVLPLDEVKLE